MRHGLAALHIGTIMVVIAFIAALLGVVVLVPPLTYLLWIPGGLALVSALVVVRGRDGGPPSLDDYLLTFVRTFAVVTLVPAASIAAFYGTCTAIISLSPGEYGGDQLGTGLLVGLVVGLMVFVCLCVKVSRMRKSASQRKPVEKARLE